MRPAYALGTSHGGVTNQQYTATQPACLQATGARWAHVCLPCCTINSHINGSLRPAAPHSQSSAGFYGVWSSSEHSWAAHATQQPAVAMLLPCEGARPCARGCWNAGIGMSASAALRAWQFAGEKNTTHFLRRKPPSAGKAIAWRGGAILLPGNRWGTCLAGQGSRARTLCAKRLDRRAMQN